MTVDAVTAEPADARPEPEGAPPNGSPAGIVRGVSYAGCFVVAFLLVLLYIRPWAEPGFDVFPEGWDLTWMQMTFVVNGQVGPFGVTDHLAFPDGYSTWSYPQLGLGAAVFAWVVVGVAGVGSALALWLFVAVAAGLNALALNYLFRSVVGSRLVPLVVCLAAVIGASSFVLFRIHNANLIPFALIPLVLGVLIRLTQPGAALRLGTLLLVAVSALISPLWWVTVAVLLLPLMAVPELFRRDWRALGRYGSVLGAVLVGFVFQTVMYLIALPAGYVETRGPWQSNAYAGFLSDLLLTSPWVTDHISALQAVRVGSSGDLAQVGMIGGVGAVCAVIAVLAGPPRRWRGFDTRVLSAGTVVAVLYFVVGGLGNLQEAAAVLVGLVSPARVWSRMLLIIAILGIAWILLVARGYLDRHPLSRNGSAVVGVSAAVLLLGVWGLDASATPRTGWDGRSLPVATAAMPEAAPIAFIQAATDPCPVAQLPVNGMPNWRVFRPYDIVYRGLIPYVMEPDWYWSLGSNPTGDTAGLAALPTVVSDAELIALADQGYCAVLYDKELARAAIDQDDTELPGRDLGEIRDPDFVSGRYSVYLLDPAP